MKRSILASALAIVIGYAGLAASPANARQHDMNGFDSYQPRVLPVSEGNNCTTLSNCIFN
jgi:hypothetical protein